MKIKFEFPTRFKAQQYLKDRGWVQVNSTLRFDSIFTHSEFSNQRLVYRVGRLWYIGTIGTIGA